MENLLKSAILGICMTAGMAVGAQETTHTAYMVADAHLDTQWNWDIQSTIRTHVWNTVNRNIALLNNYPDYIFNFEGGVKYAFMKEYYPREFELVRDWVKDGRWHISGASWEASDAIVPSAESFIRNILQGQQFYRNEFGVESTDIFLPDCFGFGWTLPTIANHCNLIGFSSQKLMWRQVPMHPRGRKTPFEFGVWQGIDGAQILCANGFGYTQRYNNIDLTEGLDKLEVYDHMPPEFIRYYGTGDVGGSPNIPSVLSVVKSQNGEGPIKIISATSDQLFKKYWPLGDDHGLEIYDGELLMDVHGTGCYTSQTAMKLYNRQNEILGDAGERAAVVANHLGTSRYPSERFTETWRRFLWHQFHDDLTGTSIPRAYEFSWNDELLSLNEFAALTTNAVSGVASLMDTKVKGTPVVLYNPLGFATNDVVEVAIPTSTRPASVAIFDNNGRKVASQIAGYDEGNAHVIFEASVPSVGFAVYDVRLSGKGNDNYKAKPIEMVENELYSIKFDANGDIVSLYDKVNSKELVNDGRAIRLALFTENSSNEWPSWEVIKSTLDHDPVSIGNATISIVDDGPVCKTVLIEKEYDGTTFRQYMRLYYGDLAERIDFYNEVDWGLTNALLKAEFPLSVKNEKATYDLSIGAIERGNNTVAAYEVPAHYWADLTDESGDYGVTILNDCKYGWDKPDDNTLRLTLIHTPSTKNRYVYQSRQDQGLNTFTYSLVPHKGRLDRSSAAAHGERLNQRVKAFIADKHKGELGREYSFMQTSGNNFAVKAVKMAEDGNGYVVRVYDTTGNGVTDGEIIFADNIAGAYAADGTEKQLSVADFADNRLKVNIKPNGINTYRINIPVAKETVEADYEFVSLPYNKSCFTLNEFRHEGNFESGYTYPLELIPDRVVVDDIIFRMEKYEPLNGLACHSDTLSISDKFDRLYILAAAATPAGKDVKGEFKVGNNTSEIVIPSYTGFIGQWGHDGHTEGYLKPQRVAHTATHRHSAEGDEPYEFAYMFVYGFDIPKGANSIILPDNPEVVVFAATTASGLNPQLKEGSPMFRTSIRQNGDDSQASVTPRVNLLREAVITGYSGYCNNREKPEFLVDGNTSTKWCDVTTLPNYVDFDLGESRPIKGWTMTNAAVENQGYVTVSCFLQGRNSETEEWQTLDFLNANKANYINRQLPGEVSARYIRLLVTQPEQEGLGNATRIYELEVY